MNFQAVSLQNHPEWSMIRIKAPNSDERTPVHLCCVIDVSASMAADYKLENVKRSLGFLLDFLGPPDRISIITFSEKAKVIVNRISVTNDEKENIRARISLINVISNTNLSDGIIASHDCLDLDTDIVKQGVLLLTDGVANKGVTRTPELLELVRTTTNKFPGTTMSCIGYGTDHNVDLLRGISAESGGSYYVVNNLEDVAAVFGDVLGALMSCSFQRLHITLPHGTEVKTRYGIETITENDGGYIEVNVGDLPAGMEAVVLARIGAGVQIGMKGFDLHNHTTFAMGCSVTTASTDDVELQTSGEAHYLRFEVLGIVEGARSLLANVTTTRERLAEEVIRIDECIARITEYSTTHIHSLWNVLLEELVHCKRMLQTYRRGDTETSQVLGQRTMYLANMRGIPATCSQVHTDDSSVPPTPNVLRTFSNAIQQSISSQLQTTCSPAGLTRRNASERYSSRSARYTWTSSRSNPIGTLDDDDQLMLGLVPPPLPFEPSSDRDEIKRITINLSHNVAPPSSPVLRAAGGAGASSTYDYDDSKDGI